MELASGVYENTYMPTRDLRCPYTMDTLLVDMLHDERVVRILKEKLPQIAPLLGDPEAGNWTLEAMQYMGYLHLTPENTRAAIAEILLLGSM